MSLLTPLLIAKENLRVHQERLANCADEGERRMLLMEIELDKTVIERLEKNAGEPRP